MDVIESIKTIDDSDIILTETIIGQGNFASVKKGMIISIAILTYTKVNFQISFL